MELVTAVLAGDRSLELRVFSMIDITVAEEQRMTRQLCSQMDLNAAVWRRYDLLYSLDLHVI